MRVRNDWRMVAVTALVVLMGATTASAVDSKAAASPEDNPTTKGGRGEPDLHDPRRPAAWIHIDDKEGRFVNRAGFPQVQWMIEGGVSRKPTFRVEVYKPLLGEVSEFRGVLHTHESPDNTLVAYLITAEPGKFKPGQTYSLISPGEGFTIRDLQAEKEVDIIPLLSPATYSFTVAVGNTGSSKEALAISNFNVRADLDEGSSGGGEKADSGESSDAGEASESAKMEDKKDGGGGN